MDGFLLPLIGEPRLNLVLNPKRCPGANIRHKAHLMALTCLHTNRMTAQERKRKEAKEWRREGKCAVLCYRVIIDFPSALQRRFFSKHILP